MTVQFCLDIWHTRIFNTTTETHCENHGMRVSEDSIGIVEGVLYAENNYKNTSKFERGLSFCGRSPYKIWFSRPTDETHSGGGHYLPHCREEGLEGCGCRGQMSKEKKNRDFQTNTLEPHTNFARYRCTRARGWGTRPRQNETRDDDRRWPIARRSGLVCFGRNARGTYTTHGATRVYCVCVPLPGRFRRDTVIATERPTDRVIDCGRESESGSGTARVTIIRCCTAAAALPATRARGCGNVS